MPCLNLRISDTLCSWHAQLHENSNLTTEWVLVSGKFFLQNKFFSAQLVSAQRLSALFPLPNFFSVVNLNFIQMSCLACLPKIPV